MTDGCQRTTKNVLDIWKIVRAELSEGRNIAIATVIDTWGSSPVPIGGQMAILENGAFQGSVSGGCVETDVIVAASDSIETGRIQRLRFGVTNERAWESGLPCGGNIQILIQPLRGATDIQFTDRLIDARKTRRSALIETDLASGERTLHENCDSLREPLKTMYNSGRSGIFKSGSHETFVHTVMPSPRILIVGATHIAQALVAISETVNLSPIVIDPRESFASQARFSDTEIMRGWPKEVLPNNDLDAHTAVIALAHVDHIDDEALSYALSSPARYIGALGSTRNHARRQARLLEAGFLQADIDRIRSPIGIDIGAVTPEEIALAIAAEVVLSFRGSKRKSAS